MFTAYYALSFNPFTNEIDTKYSFQSKDFIQASARLELLRQHKGIGLINGEPGCGKSFVLRCFVSSLSKSLYKTVYIPITTLTVREFYRALCDGLGVILHTKRSICLNKYRNPYILTPLKTSLPLLSLMRFSLSLTVYWMT